MKTIYQCEYCAHLELSREQMEDHEAACFFNQASQKCSTCDHHSDKDGFVGLKYGNIVQGCDRDRKVAGFKEFVSTKCPRWVLKKEKVDKNDKEVAEFVWNGGDPVKNHNMQVCCFVTNESFKTRGIGLGGSPGCFVCGGEQKLMTNMAAFVESKESGENIVEMFQSGAYLDYRDYEPNWIQVKVGVCDKHVPNLRMLQGFTRDGIITKDMVDEAVKGLSYE